MEELIKDKKKEANNFGLFAENRVAEEYIKKNYVILEKRWRLGKTEIDLIAQKDNLLIIIEVKARSGKTEDALSSVTKDKVRRMIKAADAYIRSLKGEMEYRFDIVTVTGDFKNYIIEFYENAFVATDIF